MRSRFSFVFSIVVVLSAVLAGCSSVPVNLPATSTFKTPNDTLAVDGIGKFGSSDTILVPSIYLHLLTKGTYKQSKGGAHARATFAVTNMDPALGTELASAIHADLVGKLEASGWKVLTYADTQDQRWDKVDKAGVNKELDAPGHDMNLGFGKQYWLTFSPEGVPVFDPMTFGTPGSPDVHGIHRKIARKVDANLLFPVYRFNAPIPYGETSRGYKKNRAEVNVMPGLELAYADSGQYSVKGAWGWVRLEEPVRLADDVGSVTEVTSSNEKNYILGTGTAFRSIGKGDYSMSLDLDKYKAEILKAAKDYNTSLVAALEPVIKKK